MQDAFSVSHLVFSFTVIVVAYLVRGITGFGSGLIAIPLLAIYLPLPVVVPLVVTLDYLASASQGLSEREKIRWREILPLLPFTVIGVGLALYLFKTVDHHSLLQALALFILFFALYTLFFSVSPRNHSRLWAVPAGSFGGLVGTLFGTGGPFYATYLQLRSLDKTQFRATFAATFLLDGSYRIAGYLYSGFFDVDLLMLLSMMLPVMAISIYLGGHIHTSISQETFKRGISILLLGSGATLLLR